MKQEQKIQFKNGVQIEESIEEDLWCMMVPPELEVSNGGRSVEIIKQPSRNMF